MDIVIIAILVIFGIFLMIMEIFFLPGLTIAGIGSIIFIGGAGYYSYLTMGAQAMGITVIASIIIFCIAFFYFLKSKTWNKIALNTNIDSKVDTNISKIKVGDIGKTLSRLAPIGKAMINNEVIEAKAEDELIDEEQDVVVTEIHSFNVIVKKKN